MSQRKLDLTPHQALALVAIESAQNALASSISQLENFGLGEEANVLKVAHKQVIGDKQNLVERWTRIVQLAEPAALRVIEGKRA